MSLTPNQRRMLNRAASPGATVQELCDAGGYSTLGHGQNAIRKLIQAGLIRRSASQAPLVAYETVKEDGTMWGGV